MPLSWPAAAGGRSAGPPARICTSRFWKLSPPLQAVARMSQSSHLVTCPGHLTRDRNLLRVFALGSNGHNLCMRLRRCLAKILSSLMVEVFPRLQHVDQQRVAIAMLIPPLQLLVYEAALPVLSPQSAVPKTTNRSDCGRCCCLTNSARRSPI